MFVWAHEQSTYLNKLNIICMQWLEKGNSHYNRCYLFSAPLQRADALDETRDGFEFNKYLAVNKKNKKVLLFVK